MMTWPVVVAAVGITFCLFVGLPLAMAAVARAEARKIEAEALMERAKRRSIFDRPEPPPEGALVIEREDY